MENFLSKNWFVSCFSDPDWVLVSTFNVDINLLNQREVKDNVCCRFSSQMNKWKLPHVISSLNLRGKPLWQHTIFRKAMDKTLWRKKSSKSAVYRKVHVCENQTKCILVRLLAFSSNVCLRATRWKAMAKSCHVHRISEKLAAGRYNVTYYNLDTKKNWRCLIENRIQRHVWLKTYLRYPLNSRIYHSSSTFEDLNTP